MNEKHAPRGEGARAEKTSGDKEGQSAPRFSPGRPSFGLARDQGRRVEVSFAMKNGGMLTVVEELDEPLTAELLQQYSDKLAGEISEGGTATRTFADAFSASGQRAWVILREVVAFSVRPAK